ncbi:hypothetical protein ES705_35198 [subsurface metagenome]
MNSATYKTYRELLKMLNTLQIENRKILNRVDELNKEIIAVETTLQLIGYKGKEKAVLSTYGELVKKLREKRKKDKMTQIEALIEIAHTIGEENKFKIKEAKQIMINAGFFENPKNANSILYTIIERSEKFEKIEPGIYKPIE